MKGIVLAAGKGTRLYPITLGISKQLLPVYNKPMIYYPLSVLLLGGIKDILIISTPNNQPLFKQLLGDGSDLGITLSYAIQTHPRGLADAFLIAKDFIANQNVCLILGDNIFYGNGLEPLLIKASQKQRGATFFGYEVKDPSRYGVVEYNSDNYLISIEEKPAYPKSNIALTGLYFYDNQVVSLVAKLNPSVRGELEITDLNRLYVEKGIADVHIMGRGLAWLDTGTHDALMQAGHFIQVYEERQGLYIACLEEIAYRQGFIDKEQLYSIGKRLSKSEYGKYIMKLATTESASTHTKTLTSKQSVLY